MGISSKYQRFWLVPDDLHRNQYQPTGPNNWHCRSGVLDPSQSCRQNLQIEYAESGIEKSERNIWEFISSSATISMSDV